MTEPALPAERRTRWPADYYSEATPHPLLPSWIAYGCGAGSVLVLVIVFAGGMFLSGGGFVDFMDMVFGMSAGEMRGMYDPSVTDAQKKSLEVEIEQMREKMRNRELPVSAVQPFLEDMRKVMADDKIESQEAARLVESARKTQTTPALRRP